MTAEKQLAERIQTITPPDKTAAQSAREHWNALAKPLGSLGLLEDAITQIAALTGEPQVQLKPRRVIVFCADNGVVAQGVTQSPQSVTATVAHSLAKGITSVCRMAQVADCQVLPVDMGIADYAGEEGVLNCRIRNGTNDCTKGPAMSREEAAKAVLAGVNLVQKLAAEGVKLIATGEMGIGNTTTAACVLCALLGAAPEKITGRGAGLSDEGLQRKKAAVQAALAANQAALGDPLGILASVGGLDIAGMCGAFLGGALAGVPVLADGVISAAAALLAVRLCPESAKAILASHVSAEPAGALALEALGKKPLITAGLRLGEGTGAVAAMPLLDMALAVYQEGYTFASAGLTPYKKLGGGA